MATKHNIESFPEVSLEEILQNEVVLLDCNMRHADDTDFYWNLGDVKSYSELDITGLDNEIQIINNFKRIYLVHPQIKFSEKVVEEFERLHCIVADKINYLSRRRDNVKRARKKTRYDSEENYSYNFEEGALRNLQAALFDLSVDIKREEIGYNENQKHFLEMIKIINGIIGLKKDKSEMFGKHKSEKYENNDTDEDVIALSYCLALKGKSCGILTQDTDHLSLAGVCTHLISSEDFFEYNFVFRKAIKECGPKIYFKKRKEAKMTLSLNTRTTEFDKEFKIYRKSQEENIKIRRQIKDLWIQIYNSLIPEKQQDPRIISKV